jgi:xylan 1,4-beta-xylosidase
MKTMGVKNIVTHAVLWTAKPFVAGLICVSTTPNLKAAEIAESPSSATNAIVLEADDKAAGRPLVHFWSRCVGAGRANEGLRASWLEQLKLVHDECGFQYVRFHGLFHNDMFVYHETTNGLPVYNWQYVDDLFDRMLAIGVRPFVELSFNPIDPLPAAGADSRTNAPGDFVNGRRRNGNGQFWWRANASPPSDDKKWAGLVEAFVRHCIARYGIDEVRQWYFEVWNEPNLDAFFHGGTQQQSFDLYKVTVLAIKKIDPSLRVGGPATSNFHVNLPAGRSRVEVNHDPTPADVEALNWQPVWVEDFITFCHTNQLPLDFISTHPYPQDFPLDDLLTGRTVRVKRGVDATKHDLTLLRKIVDSSSFPKAEIQLTEWSSSPSSRDFTHDCLPAAAFVVKANLDSIGLVNSLSYWTFTDLFEEKGAGDTIFHGGFGLVNYQGIVKPTFHAYQFLNALGDELLAKTDGAIMTRHSDTDKLTVLAYRYPPEVKISLPKSDSLVEAESMMTNGHPAPLKITLTGLPPRAAVLVETLDKTHGNAVAAWEAVGKPEPPTREQAAELRKAAMAVKQEIFHADESGQYVLERQIEPWSLVLIEQQ